VQGGLSALGQPAALHLELQPPPSSVARGLRLRAGQPAAMVTIRFDDQAAGQPAALTVAALRPDLFRIVIDSPAGDSPVSAVSTRDAFDDAAGAPEPPAAVSVLPAGTSAQVGEGIPPGIPRVSFLPS
jgi:hypothetical protein